MARHLYRATLSRLTRRGANVEIVETASHGEGMKATAEALSGRFDAVVAAGGDGMVHDAAEGLVGHSIPLGILPLGTGNVFARELKLPTSPDMIARTLLFGDVRTIPVGQANGRPFLFVVGVGFDAEAVRLFESEGNRTLGRAGYIWPVLRALLSHQDQSLQVRTRREEATVQWVVVTRIKRYAGGLILVPQADVHQPSFYIVRFVGSGPVNRLRQLSALALGLLRYDSAVHLEAADWVRIDGNRTVPVQIDGEVLGELPLEISIHPKRLRLIFPVR
jgi:YegS/Rv2252/BmrU family lipid kinase